jgi:hypothetical protein
VGAAAGDAGALAPTAAFGAFFSGTFEARTAFVPVDDFTGFAGVGRLDFDGAGALFFALLTGFALVTAGLAFFAGLALLLLAGFLAAAF